MLSTQAIYRKVKNLYDQADRGNIPIEAAINRIKAILRDSGNPKVKPYYDSWSSFVDIHEKSYFLRKMEKEYPTIEDDEAEFEHKHLDVPMKEARENGKQVRKNMLRDFNDVYQIKSKLVQYNSHSGRYEPGQTSGLKVLIHDLNIDNKNSK